MHGMIIPSLGAKAKQPQGPQPSIGVGMRESAEAAGEEEFTRATVKHTALSVMMPMVGGFVLSVSSDIGWLAGLSNLAHVSPAIRL